MPEKPTVWDLTYPFPLSGSPHYVRDAVSRLLVAAIVARVCVALKVLRQAKILFRAATSCAAPARLPALTQRAPLGGRQGSPANAHAGQARSVGRRSAAKSCPV